MPQPQVMTIQPPFSRLGVGEQHRRHHAVAEQDQERRPDHFRPEDAQEPSPPQTLASEYGRGHTTWAYGEVKPGLVTPNRVRIPSAWYGGTNPVDRTCRRHPAAALRPRPAARRGRARGRARAARRGPYTESCGRCAHVGFVEQDPESGKYQLGAALLHMGSSYLDGNELRTRALNWSDSLATRSGESVRIGTLHEGQVLVVHHVFRPDDSRQALEVGALLPAHASALGKVLLAANRYAATELAAGGLPRFTPRDDHRRDRAHGRARRGRRARLGRRRSRSWSGRGVRRGADRRPPRRDGRGDRDLRARSSGSGATTAPAAISSPTCVRRRGRYRATSGPSPGRKQPVSEQLHRLGRPGHRVLALPRSSTARRGSCPSARSSTSSSIPRPGPRRARRAADLAQRPVRRRRRARRGAAHRARPRRARHHQPARDDRAVGPRDRRAGAQRDHVAGHAHRPAGA